MLSIVEIVRMLRIRRIIFLKKKLLFWEQNERNLSGREGFGEGRKREKEADLGGKPRGLLLFADKKTSLFSLIATVLLFPAWVGVMCLHAKLPLRTGVRYLSGCLATS